MKNVMMVILSLTTAVPQPAKLKMDGNVVKFSIYVLYVFLTVEINIYSLLKKPVMMETLQILTGAVKLAKWSQVGIAL